jgi:SHS2 domain-containing protein
MYELFEHTADLGLRVRAPDLDALFAEAAVCLFSAIVENPSAVQPTVEEMVELSGTDREYLLFDWLRELLYRFDAEHMVYSEFAVKVRPDGLTATVRGEKLDPARHALSHEVKAITYHGLKVEQTSDGWLAEVIVDI